MPQYRVVTKGDIHQVIVVSGDRELPCTQPTRDPALAKQWCANLRRAASAEEDRNRQAKA